MKTTSLARAGAAEAIGTFALVFAGAGAIMVNEKTEALGHVGIALTFGLVIMAMIYAVGHISGAHFNPAVSFAFALTRHFPWSRVAVYWVAQLVGAIWIYLLAPLLGASLGGFAYQLVRGGKARPALVNGLDAAGDNLVNGPKEPRA